MQNGICYIRLIYLTGLASVKRLRGENSFNIKLSDLRKNVANELSWQTLKL